MQTSELFIIKTKTNNESNKSDIFTIVRSYVYIPKVIYYLLTLHLETLSFPIYKYKAKI